MSVPKAQAAIPRTGAAVPSAQQELKREQTQAPAGGSTSPQDALEPQARPALNIIQGEAAALAAQGQAPAARPAPRLAAARELPREHQVESAGNAALRQLATEGRARVCSAVMERMGQFFADVEDRLNRYLETPGHLGVVNLSQVLSESSITYELWKDPSTVPERRARMAAALGVPPEVDDATLLRTLMGAVREAFVAFKASTAGREALQRYEQVLQRYEKKKVLPVVAGHDTGPILGELARLGITHEVEFSRSLLVHPLVPAVGLTPDEGSERQVMIAGLSVLELGSLVALLRKVNPRLTNRQVCQLLLRESTERANEREGKPAFRKSLGQADVARVVESAYNMLRFTVFEMFFV